MRTVFVRPSLRNALIDEIRSLILRGEMQSDSAIVEAEMAKQLGVSRTPLREALIALERDGFLDSIPGRGFFVPPLTAPEAEETYPIVGALEALALRMQGSVVREKIEDLARTNRELLVSRDSGEALLNLDDAWHRQLLSGCDNQKLLKLISQLKRQIRRYEFAYMTVTRAPATSASDHEAISEMLLNNKVARAAEMLQKHWGSGVPVIVSWIQGSPGKGLV